MFLTGIGKVTNLLAERIQFINTNYSSSSSQVIAIDENFYSLFQLEYDFYVPIVRMMSGVIYDELFMEVKLF